MFEVNIRVISSIIPIILILLVVDLAFQDRESPIKLLQEENPGQIMGESHGRKTHPLSDLGLQERIESMTGA
jgi:hypothetical protein